MRMLSTSDLMTAPNAAPMMTPIARSITLPLKANALNSSNSDMARFAGLIWLRSMHLPSSLRATLKSPDGRDHAPLKKHKRDGVGLGTLHHPWSEEGQSDDSSR